MLTAAKAAILAQSMLQADPDDLRGIWRFVIIQLFDDYTSTLRRHGRTMAAKLFQEEPVTAGDSRIDAALAALAEHLARRDGWAVPPWAARRLKPAVPWWFVADLKSLEAMAIQQAPLSFSKRGVFILDGALDRA